VDLELPSDALDRILEAGQEGRDGLAILGRQEATQRLEHIHTVLVNLIHILVDLLLILLAYVFYDNVCIFFYTNENDFCKFFLNGV
jgi:hypothetical protein